MRKVLAVKLKSCITVALFCSVEGTITTMDDLATIAKDLNKLHENQINDTCEDPTTLKAKSKPKFVTVFWVETKQFVMPLSKIRKENRRNDKRCKDFVKATATNQRNITLSLVEKAQYLSMVSDGSTDSSHREAEICYVRLAIHGEIFTKFVGLKMMMTIKLDSPDVKDFDPQPAIDIWLQKKRMPYFSDNRSSLRREEGDGPAEIHGDHDAHVCVEAH